MADKKETGETPEIENDVGGEPVGPNETAGPEADEAEIEKFVSFLESSFRPREITAPVNVVTGVGDAIDAAMRAVDQYSKVEPIDIVSPDGISVPAYLTANGVETIPDSVFDPYRESPLRREGTAVLTRLESFIDHANRFSDEDSAIFANDSRTSPALYSVLDYHRADSVDEVGEYRWGNHRGAFHFPLSDEWKAWMEKSGKPMKMREFAAFLEDRIIDIAAPPPFDDMTEETQRFVTVNGGVELIADYAKLVELSRGLRVNEDSTVQEAHTLSSGEGHVMFSAEHRTTKVGPEGLTIKVPTMFFVAIPVFAKGAIYRLGAQLRYRKTNEGLIFWFDNWRWDRAFDHAFAEAVDLVKAETSLPVFYGIAEQA